MRWTVSASGASATSGCRHLPECPLEGGLAHGRLTLVSRTPNPTNRRDPAHGAARIVGMWRGGRRPRRYPEAVGPRAGRSISNHTTLPSADGLGAPAGRDPVEQVEAPAPGPPRSGSRCSGSVRIVVVHGHPHGVGPELRFDPRRRGRMPHRVGHHLADQQLEREQQAVRVLAERVADAGCERSGPTTDRRGGSAVKTSRAVSVTAAATRICARRWRTGTRFST